MERRKDIERARYDRQAEGAGEDADLAEWGARAIAPELRAPYLEFEQEAQRAAGEGPVLDIGAGTGLHSLAASRPGRTVIATDISRPALRVACRRAAAAGQTLHSVCADAEALPFRSSRFPLVTSAGSLYCLDFDAVCAEARRVLTPEGVWVLVDSYDRNPVYRLNRLLGYFMGRRTWLAVTNVPSARTIRRLREGFREVRVSFHGSFLFVAPLLHFALGTERTSRLLERADGWFGGRLREFAFKIVVVARGPRPNGGEEGELSMTVSDVTRGEELLRWVDAQPRTLGQAWLEGLEERKREEAEFHNADRAGRRDEDPESTPNRRFYEAAGMVKSALADRLASLVPGAAFLDFACGNGNQTIAAARGGATAALGIDISDTSVRNATEAAAEAGVATVARFLQRDCEETGLPGGAFEVCLCSGMLHHLDLSRAFPELYRIMAPGGRILCLEALAYNPFIQLYRNLTPSLRTEWERRHILGLREVRYARQWFEVEKMRFFLLTAPLATLLPSGAVRRAGLRVAHIIDAVATRAPLLKYWSWMFTFELVKVR